MGEILDCNIGTFKRPNGLLNKSVVVKRGITTGNTRGIVVSDNFNYLAAGKPFLNLIMIESSITNPFTTNGDSGSLVFVFQENTLYPIGIHRAGITFPDQPGKLFHLCSDLDKFFQQDNFKGFLTNNELRYIYTDEYTQLMQ